MPRVYRVDKLDMPDVEALEPIMRRAVLRQGLRVVALYLRQNVPDSGIKHKGKLNKSIKYSAKAGGLLGKVRATAPHAHLVHEGTGAHPTILNKRRDPMAKALSIPGVGFRHSAQHPGSRANPFLLDAAAATAVDVEIVMREEMVKAAEAVAAGATR